MPFEETMLVASVTRAIASIPGAIINIKELFSKKKTNNHETLKAVNDLCGYIIDFSEIAGWLEEIKRLHENLQRFDEVLEDVRRQYQKAIASGRFISQEYRISEVRKTWEFIKKVNLNATISFAQKIRRIEKESLKIGTITTGPEWAKRFVALSKDIDICFKKYDEGNENIVIEIADYFNQLSSHVRYNLSLADERLRKETIELGRALSELGGTLKHVRV